MLLKKSSIVYNQVTEGNTGAGGTNAQAAPPVPPPAQSTPPPQAQGSIEFDQFGYPKTPPQQPPAPNKAGEAAKPPATTPPAPAEVASGYEAEPPAPDVAGYQDPATPATLPPVPTATELVDMKELPEAKQKEFGEYFTANKIPKEAQKAVVDIFKKELATQAQAKAEYEKQIQAQTLKIKSDWYNELKNDKDFGGANFDSNIKLVNKFVQEFMPNTKKMLTEKGGMLPPSTMRDFYSVAKRLFETEKFVQGDGSPASETKQGDNWKFLSELYPNNG